MVHPNDSIVPGGTTNLIKTRTLDGYLDKRFRERREREGERDQE